MTFLGTLLSVVILLLIKLWSNTAFWIIVILLVLGFLNISISAAFYFVVALTFIMWVWQHFDRKRHPEKWKKIDDEDEKRRIARAREAVRKEKRDRPKVAEKYYREYQSATERIPKSEWILMNREEKSQVFRRRERLKNVFQGFPHETQELIRNKYSIDDSFPGI